MNNASYSDNYYENSKKDFDKARRNFLFFSGPGNVHKGLDLLLEVFVRASANLYICQNIRSDFFKVYKNELENYNNIHVIGSIPLRSSIFYQLIDKCAFIIHPSCAEGQPGSVVECMHQGLIPVVSQESNIDTEDFGITLKSCSIKEIIDVVEDLSHQSVAWCEMKSRLTRIAALKKFSEEIFLLNMKNAIQNIINISMDKKIGEFS
ncbi:MAG: hypothetical protein A2Y62_01830 [Candidatus Fischerbacteria bacterium RBG_13_37_8]|uniref:Glycosyl transferase family 1 domain-containing protein n=1 Tax=Candidatus Fischerbacteria bacterium RBG_13_37_8 TaxID=1817863 RepID=A0A1F5VDN9_9BACT|nr:MAG: hypothetical protein A2Y62_01830 [Candidatus Fischerbacteria bacterium RBG_13_37_8]